MDIGKTLCALLQFAYEDGLEGVTGYPLDAKAEAIASEKAMGKPLNRRAVKRMIKCINREYTHGKAARIKA